MNILKLLSAAALSLLASQGIAETALTITGKVAPEGKKVIQYSVDDLKALDQTSHDTTNDFVDVPTQFSGPLLRDVLAPLTIPEDAILKMTALNDYQFNIPFTDAINYDVIVALEKNGAPMRIRENGPLWIIYPMSDHEELQAPIYNSRLIWQLTNIEVK